MDFLLLCFGCEVSCNFDPSVPFIQCTLPTTFEKIIVFRLDDSQKYVSQCSEDIVYVPEKFDEVLRFISSPQHIPVRISFPQSLKKL